MRWLFGFIFLGPEYNHKGTCKEERRRLGSKEEVVDATPAARDWSEERIASQRMQVTPAASKRQEVTFFLRVSRRS